MRRTHARFRLVPPSSLLALVLLACAPPTDLDRDVAAGTPDEVPGPGTVVLADMAFGTSEVQARSRTILHARVESGGGLPAEVHVASSDGWSKDVILVPLSHEEDATAALAARLARGPAAPQPNALIGFKEAGLERGVEDGEVLVSDATVAAMKAWIGDLGVEIVHGYTLSPSVAARVPIDLELIERLRSEPRIDYLEDNMAGKWTVGASSLPDLRVVELDLASLEPSPGPGATLMATYIQPDGTVVSAVAVVR